jgi:hypothetical protein
MAVMKNSQVPPFHLLSRIWSDPEMAFISGTSLSFDFAKPQTCKSNAPISGL